MSAELAALLLADARLPTGGHAHSACLEPALQAGLSVQQVPRFIETRLRSVGLVEAAGAVLARRAAATDPAGIGAVQAALLARSPSEPLRAASELLGRGLARLAGQLWPGHPAVAALDRVAVPLRPVALGVVAAAAGLDDAHCARVSLYDDAQTVAAAALKLLPVDPAEATRWVLETAPVLDEILDRAVAVDGPNTLPAVTAPQVEQWSLEHATRARRLFVA